MQTYRNLVSDSALVEETIDLLRRQQGRATALEVADAVLQLPDLEPDTAALMVAELIRDDWRVRLNNGHELELVCEDDECRALVETDFVVFDVETTGAKTPPCRIMELGAYRVSRGRIVAEFQTLVNPGMEIPPFIARLTGISDEMVRAAPGFEEVAERWLDFAGSAVLVAHNASFDVRFINHEVSRVFPGRRMANSHLCTVSLSRRVVPELPNHRLHTLAEHFAVPFHAPHRAPSDARATAGVFIFLLERLRQSGVSDLAGARRFNTAEVGGRRPEVSRARDAQV
ncbi:MAG TPA: exonuclease domain-containing protein [Pyrinomonadaceae bacterium]|nr:exonuclease domain-containing protein [Pyrinomonadaceae bacterium]